MNVNVVYSSGLPHEHAGRRRGGRLVGRRAAAGHVRVRAVRAVPFPVVRQARHSATAPQRQLRRPRLACELPALVMRLDSHTQLYLSRVYWARWLDMMSSTHISLNLFNLYSWLSSHVSLSTRFKELAICMWLDM